MTQPNDRAPRQPGENRYNAEEIDNLLMRSTENFRPHRDVLANVPKGIDERSLQIHSW